MEAKIRSLVESLNTKTLSKEAKWERPGKADQYILTLDKGIVKIDRVVTKLGTVQYLISVVNKTGDVIIKQSGIRKKDATSTSADYDLLKTFYENIQRTYFKVEETLDDLLNEVSKKGEIGKNSDDLPW